MAGKARNVILKRGFKFIHISESMVYSVQIARMHAGKLLKSNPDVDAFTRYYERFGNPGRDALVDLMQKRESVVSLNFNDLNYAAAVAEMKTTYNLIVAGLTRPERTNLLVLRDNYQKGLVGKG
jgi:hypothetical protein